MTLNSTEIVESQPLSLHVIPNSVKLLSFFGNVGFYFKE